MPLHSVKLGMSYEILHFWVADPCFCRETWLLVATRNLFYNSFCWLMRLHCLGIVHPKFFTYWGLTMRLYVICDLKTLCYKNHVINATVT